MASETPYKLLAVSAYINLRTKMSTGITIGKDASYDLGAYLFRKAEDDDDTEALLELALRDAWVTFDCSGGSRTNVRNMFVFHPGVSNSHIDVAVGDLYKRVTSALKLSSGVYGEPSKQRFRNLLNGSGAVWDIKDPAEYFYWRDVTKAYLWESSLAVRSVALRTGKRDEILDHFAHLILAVLTTSDVGV